MRRRIAGVRSARLRCGSQRVAVEADGAGIRPAGPRAASCEHRLPAQVDTRMSGRRNNGRMQATTPAAPARSAGRPCAGRRRRARSSRRAGWRCARSARSALLGVLTTRCAAGAGAAAAPSQYVPRDAAAAGRRGSPGPLRACDVGLSSASFQTLMLLMCASYVLVLRRRARAAAARRSRRRSCSRT